MPHHYPKSTVYVQVFCPTCNKQTVHHVWDGRLGRCVEDHSKVKPQEIAAKRLAQEVFDFK